MDLSSSIKEIILTSEEKHVYSKLFQVADEDKEGVITGANAVKLFGKSGLPQQALGRIWQIADSENKGFLTKQTFSVAVKLIAQVQNGQSPDPTKINADGPLPRFEGIYIEPYQTLSGPGSLEPPATNKVITDEDREKYKVMFYKLNPVNGILDGEKAKDFFVRSKLPVEKLSQIWVLADTKMRGKLDLAEFIIAMYFIEQSMKDTIKALPSELPPEFYEMASGTSAPASPPSFPRTQSPTIRHMTLDSSMTTSIFQDNSWDVTESEKLKYDQLYGTVDKDKMGYLTGEEAANFFMKSKLTPDQLAQIWDLADINKSGHLNRDEFAVAMHLIVKKKAGVPLPTSIPKSLIPPSMRAAAGSLKRSATTVNSRTHTSSAPLSDPDLFFDSLHHISSSSPFSISQPEAEIDLLGDTDMNTKIALESGEIKNYKLQSENLNNTTTELKVNRANLESSISSLVTQKQDMMAQLSQVRTLYESETKAIREVQAKYDSEHESFERVKQELLQAEKALRALQLERDQLQANIQKDRDETTDIKKRMRIAEEETVTIKAEIEKLKKDGRQQKGFLAINRKQLAAVEGEKEKAKQALQSLAQDVKDPFGTGAFTPLAFNPSNTTQAGSQSISEKSDFNEPSSSLQKLSSHSNHGSISSIASNSTLGASSIKSAPSNINKPDELSFDKPITVASSKPSELENFFSENLSSAPQDITNVSESNKIANPFDPTFNDPFGEVGNNQTNKSIQNSENTTLQDAIKENEKSETDLFANFKNNSPTSGKTGFDSAFTNSTNSTLGAQNNDNLSSDSFTKEYPSIEEFEGTVTKNASNLGFDNDFTSLTTNNEKDENLKNNYLMESNSSVQNESNAASVNNMETKNDDKDNKDNKESDSPFSIVGDSETTFPPLQDSDAWVSIESSAKSTAPQDDFDASFSDLTEAKVTKTPPIDFDAEFDDEFDDDVKFTFDAPTTPAKQSSTNGNNPVASSTTGSSLNFDKKAFDDFDPFSPSATSSSNKSSKANLDEVFGGITAEPPKDIGFDDAFAEFIKPPSSSKNDLTNTISVKASTASQPKLQSTTDDDIDDVKRLLEIGYTREKVIDALERYNYDFEKSANYLADNS